MDISGNTIRPGWLMQRLNLFLVCLQHGLSQNSKKMVEAAVEAGIENPSRGSEPEAMAAIFFAQHETSLKVCSYPK
jgi:hypothetical protein